MSDTVNTRDVDYVHPTLITAWQLIGAVLAVVAVVVYSLWTIVANENVNNKAISDDIKKNYVTKSNHDDLVNRFIDFRNDTVKHIDDMETRRAFNDWLKERDKLVDRMQSSITRVRNDSASKDALVAMQQQINLLREEMQRVSDREDRRHINDSQRAK